MRRYQFKRVVASVAAVTVMVTGTPQMGLVYASPLLTSTYALSNINVLNASELELSPELTEEATFGKFTLTKGIVVDGNVKSGEDNLAFTQRIKLGGTGSIDSRSVCFDTTGPATVTIYCLSGSSTADRKLTVYDAKTGQEVGSVDALGKENPITKRTVRVEAAGSYYVASPDSSVNIYYMAVEQDAQKVLMHSIFNPSKLDVKTLNEDTSVDGYTIKADATKAVDVAAMAKDGPNNMSFVNALKLNGTGEEAVRSLHFSTEGEATVTVYALSGGAERNFALYKAGSKDALNTFPVAVNTTTLIEATTLQITEAGDYYLASPSGGVNVFYVDVAEMKEGEAAPERPSWAAVQSPELVSAKANTLNASEILVDWKMDISDAGADRVEAELIDTEGKVNVKATHRTEGTDGTLVLKPTKSGNFKVVLKAYRAGEEEVKTSSELEVKDYVRPLDSFNITKSLTGKNTTLQLAWEAVSEADTYNVSYKEVGTDNIVEVATGLTETEYVITSGLQALKEYEVTVIAVRGTDTKTATTKKVVQAEAERWLSGLVGSGSKGSEIKVNADGTITMNNTSGKIAESEDQFSYYYTEIDPKAENFELTATFTVDSSSSKDNQSGFGIMAVDTLDTVNDARYMNSVGSMVTRFTVDAVNKQYLYGIPGLRTITGYTEAPTDSQAGKRVMDATKNFDPDFNIDKVKDTSNPNQPRFFDGEEYTFTLKRCNGGYVAKFKDENGKEYDEIISYDETLLAQDSDKLYVGFVVGRKITATVSNISFTTVKPEEDTYVLPARPITYIEPTIKSDTTKTTSSTAYNPVFISNVTGLIDIADEAGNILANDIPVLAKQRKEIPLTLKTGTNNLKVTFTPSVKETQDLPDYTDLSSYDPITYNVNVTVKAYGTEENAIYVSPNGTANGEGTKASPLDIYTAVSYVQPGQEILLLGGEEYNLSKGIEIPRGINGTEDKRITLMSAPNEKAVLNFENSTTGGIILSADYWHIYDLEIKNTEKGKPMHIQGNNNIAEKLLIHDNKDTGLQINGSSEESYDMWPSNNLVQSVEVYNSCDPLRNDADGFAAKITVGDGNVFRYCISHHNIDDGWDLYAKSTSGSIGVVTIDSCVAYSNGQLTPADGEPGEGNGFKLGGESMPGAHILKNSISFNNLAKGVTSNSGPDPQVYNVTSFANGAENMALYTNNAASTNYKVEGFLSYQPGKSDYIEVKNQDKIDVASNYLNGVNNAGVSVKDSWFVSTTPVVPTFNQDGTINLGDFLTLSNEAAADTGARFVANPNPTEIIVGTEIGTHPVVTEKPTTTPIVTAVPTAEPTATPIVTAAPTKAPVTQAPTVKPTVKPTTKPTATPKPTVKPVAKVAISKTTVSSISNKTYTGKAIKPSVTVKYKKTKLKNGKDYTVSYRNNVKTGKATITIKGKGNYTGTKKVTFKIVPKKVGSLKVASKKTKTATVTYKKVTGASGYQISYKTSKNGKYKVAGYTTKTSKTITKLSKKKTIYVRVRAYKTINGKKYYGSYSSVKSVRVR
ncbi:MAG: fibronectin type III domain-containing protein [bacterium]|nr:fibronectin type III domain-containing protein [bacterium]